MAKRKDDKKMTLTKQNTPVLHLADGVNATLQMDTRHFSSGFIGMSYAVCEAKLQDSESKKLVGTVTGRMGGGVDVKIYDSEKEGDTATFFIDPRDIYALVKKKYDEQYPAIIADIEKGQQ